MKKILPILLSFIGSFSSLSAQNMLANGGFEAGGSGSGFNVSGSVYTLIAPPYSGNTTPGNYAITTNAQPLNAVYYLAGGDHTSGTGNMLVVDGATNATGQPKFWEAGNTPGAGLCGLTIGRRYQFSYWVRSVSSTTTNAATQASLQLVTANASVVQLISGAAQAPLPAAGWQQVVYTFTADAACVQLSLWNSNTSAVGNDFAVDDFAVFSLPTATITASNPVVCQGATGSTITFTGANGTPPYTFNYTLNTVAQPPVTTTTGSSITIPVGTASAGTSTYQLVSVAYGTPPVSQNQTGSAVVTVRATPSATVTGTATVCKNSTGNYITFTGANGSAPYFFTYSINGGPNQLASSGASNSAAVLVPTTASGIFTYELLNVSYGSGPLCSQAYTGVTAVKTVVDVPDASISGTTSVCLNTPNTNVTFTGSGATAPYTFVYTINGGTPISVVSTGNTAVVPVSTLAPGTFTYELVSVSTGATPAPVCLENVEGEAVVTVGPPTATMTGDTTILPGGSATLTFSGTPLATVNFTSSLGPNSVVLDANGDATYNIPYITQTTVFSLVSAISGIAPFCTQNVTGNVTITVDLTCDPTKPILATVTIDPPANVCNAGECVELLAHYSNVGRSTDYTVQSITCGPSFPFTGGITIPATGDDSWSPMVNLPFPFEFYGTCYTQVLVGTNGVITFDTTNFAPLGGCPWSYNQTIPNPGFPIRNAIYGVYQDTDIRAGSISQDAVPDGVQNVNYYILDTGANVAPNRVFVANFNELPQFSPPNGAGLQTSQIVIHETTNIIEVFVKRRVPNNGWQNGVGVIGVQNQAGNAAVFPPGRNTGNWSAFDEAYRFLPKNIPTVPTSIRWEDTNGPIAGSLNQNPLTICPTADMTYTAIVTYPGCTIPPPEVSESITVNLAPVFPVNNPTDIDICSDTLPFTFDLYQSDVMLAGVPNAGDYVIQYYEDEQDALDGVPTDLPETTDGTGTHVFYSSSGPFPQKMFVRISNLAGADCSNVRSFNIRVGSPTGDIVYPTSPWCNSITAPQLPNTISLTPGGSYSAESVPAGSTLSLDPVTGGVIPSASDPGLYIVTYNIAANPPCPAYTTSTSVEVLSCTCTVTANSTSESPCVNTPLTAMTFTAVNASAGSISAGLLPAGVAGAFNAATNTYTISGTPTIPGTYNFTVQLISPNGPCSLAATIIVNEPHTLTWSATSGAELQTICQGDTIVPIIYNYGGGADNVTVTGLPASLTAVVDTGTKTVTISGTPAGSTAITYVVTTSGGTCPSLTDTGTITFAPNDTLTLNAGSNAAQSICQGAAIANIVYSYSGSTTTSVTVTGLPATLTATVNALAQTVTISGTPAGTLPINYSLVTTGCNPVTLTGTINFIVNDVLVLDSSVLTQNQTICVGDPIDTVVFNYTGSSATTTVNVTGLPASLTAVVNATAHTVTITGTPANNTPINFTVTTANGCNPVFLNGSINFNADDTLTWLTTSGAETQSICLGDAIVPIVYNYTSIDPNVTITGLPVSMTALVNATAQTITISGTPTSAAAITYNILTEGCNPVADTGTITVNQSDTLVHDTTSGGENQQLCLGASLVPIVYTFGGTATTTVTVTGLPATLTAVINATAHTVTISGTPTAATPISYTVTTTSGCNPVSLSGTVTFQANDVLTWQATSGAETQSICAGDAIVPIVYNFSSSNPVVNVTGLPVAMTALVDATLGTVTISGTPAAAGTINYSITTTGCNPQADSGSITINPGDTLVWDTTSGTESQLLCLGDAIAPIVYTYGGGANGVTVTGLPAALTAVVNTTAQTVTISGTPTAGTTINYTVTTTNTFGCPVVSPALGGAITFNPDDTLAWQTSSGAETQVICLGDAIAPIVYNFSSIDPNITITGLPASMSSVIDATLGTITISGTPTAAGVVTYNIGTNGCNPLTDSGSITINPTDTLVWDTTSGTESQVLCLGDAIAPIVYTYGGGANGVTVTGLPASLTAVVNTTAHTVTISGTPAAGTTITYTVTTTNPFGCPVVSPALGGAITFNADDTLVWQSIGGAETQTICVGDAIAPIIYNYSSGDPNITITGLPTSMSSVIDATSGTITISGTPTAAGVVTYNIATNGCNPLADTGTIIINPVDTLSLNTGSGAQNQTLCLGDGLTPIVFTYGGGANGVTVTGLPTELTAVVNTTAQTVTISGTPLTNTTINYSVETTNTTGCTTATLGGAINFNPASTLVLTSASANATLCNSEATPTASIIRYTFGGSATSVVVSNLPVGMTASTAGNVVTIAGTPNGVGVFNYDIETQGGCLPNVLLQGTITVVAPTLVLTSASANATICINTAFTAANQIQYTFGGSATTAVVTGLPAGMTATIAANVVTIGGTPSVPGTSTYNISTSGDSCIPVTATGTITVSPLSTLVLTSASANATTCAGVGLTPANQIRYTFGGSATSVIVTGLPSGMNASTVGNVVTISGTSSATGTSTYTITTQGGCAPDVSLTGTITVNPAATLTVVSGSLTQQLCIGVAMQQIQLQFGNGATGAVINGGGFPAGVSASVSGNIITISGTPNTAGTFTIQYDTTMGCGTASQTINIQVDPNQTLLLTSPAGTTNQFPCPGESIAPITYVAGSGATNVIVTGLPAGIGYTFDPVTGLVIISGSSNLTGPHAYTVRTVGPCQFAQLGGSIDVKPLATVVRSTPVGSDNQQICVGQTALGALTYTIGNGATSAAATGLPPGISTNFTAGVLTISGTATQAGVYDYAIATSGGCGIARLTGRITVNQLPVIVLPTDLALCVDVNGNPLPGATVQLTTGLTTPQYSFIWSDASGVIAGANGSSYFAPAPGTYSVQVTNVATGCTESAATTVATSLPPQTVVANVSSYFADDTVITVSVLPVGQYLYQLDGGAWQSGNQFFNIPSGYHTVNVKDIGNCDEKSVEVRLIDYPKFFTPNGDGYNDTWNIPDLLDQPQSKIEIYDRYGKLLKEISPQGGGWDGTMNGQQLPSTDYWFKVYFTEQLQSKTFKAHFSLKR